MFSFRRQHLSLALAFLCLFIVRADAQTPTPTPPEDPPEVVYTEEIKVNISALDLSGNFADALKKEDVVISEDGRLHQANVIQHIPANVLIILDTGGENRQAKDIKTTRDVAKSLIGSLQPNDSVALMSYNDKVDVLSDWTTDKNSLLEAITKKTTMGTRSRFVEALYQADAYLRQVPAENRHLVLITDGIDSTSNQEQRRAVFKLLTARNVNVHVFSYTGLEREVVAERSKSIGRGTKSKALPPGAGIPIQGQTQTYPIATISLDREMINKNRQYGESLAGSEKDLTQLADDTNGIFYLPATKEEMLEKASHLAKNIDSQYVISYTPKRPLSESKPGEVRTIEVTSRRDNVIIQARRKLTVLDSK